MISTWFRSHEKGLPIHHHSFKVSEKKQTFLSLLAKLAVDKHLPIFIKWQLINLETLIVDHNKILHLNVQLDLMTPDNFNDFSALQSRIAEIMMSVFKEDEWDVPLKQFLENCQTGIYLDSLDLLKDYKRLIGLKNDHDEPWFYAFLYDRYMDLKKNSKRLVAIVIVLMLLKYGYGYMQKSNAELVQPYVKTVIGLITYDDPYTEALEKEESITVESIAQDPPKTAPILPEATPKAPVAVPPAYETHVVKSGEFLIQICKDYYGDGKYAWALAKFNELKNPSLLPVGFPLKLPPKNIIESIFEKL